MPLACDFHHGAESARHELKLPGNADRQPRLGYGLDSMRYDDRRNGPPNGNNIDRNSRDVLRQQIFLGDRLVMPDLHVDVKTNRGFGLPFSTLDSRPDSDSGHVVIRVPQAPVRRMGQKSLYSYPLGMKQMRHRSHSCILTICGMKR